MELLPSKILPQFVYPVGMVTLLLILTLIIRERPRLQKALVSLALAILFIAGNSWVAVGLARSLEWRYLPPKEMPTAGAIVLLGGGSQPPVYPRSTVEVDGAGDRMIYAAHLYHQGKAPYILVSGGRIDWDPVEMSQAEEMASLLEMLGVPKDKIWLEDASRNTQENAAKSKQILEAKGVSQILLVTSATHMPRSVMLFERQGLEVIPAPTDYSVTEADLEQLRDPNPGVWLLNLFPSVGNLSQTSRAMKEYIGMLVYSIRG